MSFKHVLETATKAYETYINPNDVLVVSVSTGIDSMVLFEVLQVLKANLHVVHFNHHKRAQSEDEAKFIKDYCQTKAVMYTEVDVPTFKQNFQNNARDFRKAQLQRIASQYRQSVIVTAHHFDDQMETYIQRIFSGSSILNRQAMPLYEQVANQRYFRPLITISKQEITEAASEMNVRYFEDESNKENVYLRNKIRNKLLPLIESIFPSYRRALARDLAEIADMNDFFSEKYSTFFEQYISVNVNEVVISKEALTKEHHYFQNIVFERVLKHLGLSLKRQRYLDMQRLVKQTKGQIQLKGESVFIVDETHVILRKKQVEKQNVLYEPFFLREGMQKLPKQENLCYNNGYTSCQDILEITKENLPFLKVRYYRTGDKIEIGRHHKRVRRLFIDQKLPREKREYYPIVEDTRTSKIIWIPTMYKAQSTKANKQEDIIQIYFNDGGFYA